ncbi:MAG: hypothetical protein ROY99_06995 [Ignavibacterium sp.]|jgi:hypothetical protein|nr:hypothetical protein [Ignavibacterium sp.]
MTEIKKDHIAAFVDGEIKDELIEEVEKKIEAESDFAIEYKVQLLVKSLVKENVIKYEAPTNVRKRILKHTNSGLNVYKSANKSRSYIFEKPAFVFATALVIVFAIALIVMNRADFVEKKDFDIEQVGENNLLVQAQNNFNLILQGKLDLQINTSDFKEVLKFFHDKAVNYNAIVPEIPKWILSGAFISEEHGKNFANLVYTGENNELVYIYQIDESYLYDNHIITLNDDFIKYLDEGNCYIKVSDNRVSVLTKIESNICAVVSNSSSDTIKKFFCSQ